MTRGIAIAVVLGLAIATSIAGGLCATKPAATGEWLRGRFGRAPSDERLELLGSLVAVAGIFVGILAVICEIWWLQGTPLV